MRRIVQCLIVAGFALQLMVCQSGPQQKKLYGTVDGRPIPDWAFTNNRTLATNLFRTTHNREPTSAADEQELNTTAQTVLCEHLKSAINYILRQEEIEKLGVIVTAEDLDEERKHTVMPDPKSMREHAEAAAAASAALDKGQDPTQVYEQMVKPHGIEQAEWNVYLMNRKTEAGRAHIRRELNMTEEDWAKMNAKYDPTPSAKSHKLDVVIDDKIASTDPTFRQYLNEFRERRKDPDPHRRWTPGDHAKYLDQARQAWWKDRLSHVKVALRDLSLGQRCALNDLGVQISALQ